MKVVSVFTAALLVTCVAAEDSNTTKSVKAAEDPKFQELEAIAKVDINEVDKEVKRAKKSTTTTFCVEIRPSDPFQRPFQVCEPAEASKPTGQVYTVPSAAYYPAQSYGGQQQPKPQAAYASTPTQPKPGAVYSPPVKTYSAPTTPAPKQYAAHGLSYNTYRSKNEESGTDEHRSHMMRMNERHSAMSKQHNMRSHSDYDRYGPSSYSIPVVPKKYGSPNHNGLVITCQPNLAGYAHNVPSSSYHHAPVSHYSYRSSTPDSYGGRYGRYETQSHYSSYQRPPYKPVTNGYKHPVPQHLPARTLAGQEYGAAYGSAGYGVPQTPYTSPVYKPPAAPAYGHPAHGQTPYGAPPTSAYAHASAAASYTPQPPQPPHSPDPYGQYPQNYGPVPSAAPQHPSPAPASYPPPSAAPAYSQAQSFAANLPVPSPSSLPAPQAQTYIPPGTYREAEGEGKVQAAASNDVHHHSEKESHTMKKMEEMAHQRLSKSQWSSEATHEKMKSNGNDKLGSESSQSGWSPNMRESDAGDEMKSSSGRPEHMKHMEKKSEGENEI